MLVSYVLIAIKVVPLLPFNNHIIWPLRSRLIENQIKHARMSRLVIRFSQWTTAAQSQTRRAFPKSIVS